MNLISRTITGFIMIIFGLVFLIKEFSNLTFLIYGIIFLIIGIFILFNKKEDNIEQIKFNKGGKK